MNIQLNHVFGGRFATVVGLVGMLVFVSLAYAGEHLPATAKASQAPIEEVQIPSPPNSGQGFVVQDQFGGQIFGYDVDRNGSEGLLSEALLQGDGNYLIATETFDQTTGRITAVVEEQTGTPDDFVTLGVFGSHIGLREREHVEGGYVVRRIYNIMNPLSGHRFTGAWTPPINDMTQHFEDMAGNQGTSGAIATASYVVVMASNDSGGRFVFGSNLVANTFGPIIDLHDAVFNGGVPPLLGYYSSGISVGASNQAVLAQASGAPYSVPQIGLVNLATGSVTEFQGLGDGYINGLAVDSTTGIACTTTETDNSAEFYNLRARTGFIVTLPQIGQYSGTSVAVDTVHRLFLIAHPVPGSPGQMHVYDENGNLIESLRNFSFGPGATGIALNPNTRTGFVQFPGSSSLQSFTY